MYTIDEALNRAYFYIYNDQLGRAMIWFNYVIDNLKERLIVN